MGYRSRYLKIKLRNKNFSYEDLKYILFQYSQIRLFQSHWDEKRRLNYPKFKLSEYIDEGSKKMWMIDQEYRTSVCGGGGTTIGDLAPGPTPFPLVTLFIADSCL